MLNYKAAYDCLISLCKERGLDKKKLNFKAHKHHIIPRCLGGLNQDDNYVLLTLNEHKNAHRLLTLIHPDNNSLRKAFNLMNGFKSCLGFKHSEKSRLKLSESSKGKIISEDTKEKMRNAKLGRKLSKELKEKIGLSHIGKVNSKETREKLRVAAMKQVSFNGIEYRSVKDAAFALGITPGTFRIHVKHLANINSFI
jgi:hypothetical protein